MQNTIISDKVKEVMSLCENIRISSTECDVEIRTTKKDGRTILTVKVVPELFVAYPMVPILISIIHLDVYGEFTFESICDKLESLIIRLNCILQPSSIIAA